MHTYIKLKRPRFGGDAVMLIDRAFYKLDLAKQREMIRAMLDQGRSVDQAITRAINAGAMPATEATRNAEAAVLRGQPETA
jgi:hypothetical protein